MRKVLVDAEIRAKQKFTPNKFRTPEWQGRTNEQRAQADAVIHDADAELKSRAASREEEDE